MILIIRHIPIEGPGTLGEFLGSTTWDTRVIDLGQELPEDISDIEAVISLGGPMNVYEEEKYPFLKEEDALLKEAVKKEIPVLGICLGAQLLAKALGANIRKAPAKEIGWHKVELTKEGKADPLFSHLPQTLEVFQWHEDTFLLPEGAHLLAKGTLCKNQAFRFGKNAYGLQFHVEVTPEMIESWVKEYAPHEEHKEMLLDAYKKKEATGMQAGLVYLNFSRIIKVRQESAV